MKKAIEIWQDNVLTVARYEMSEAEKNLLYMVVAQVKKDDPPTKMYQVSVKEMAEIAGSKELMFEAYKQASRKLMTRVFETTLPNGNLLQATFIASAEYKKGTGVIELELSQKVRPYYIDLNQRFTKMQLVAAISLNSAYAKRVYELLCMYKNMKDKTFRRDLIELKTMLCIIDQKTGKDSYPDWTKFQKNILDVAAKEINGHTDVSFNYKPIYGDRPGRGRKPVTEVQFEVFYQAKIEPVQTSSLHERLVKQFRLRADQADQVLALHSIETINRQLYDIQAKAADGKVKNIGSYTAKVFGLQTTKENRNGE
ncbi:replication initiation protein [Spirosoma utsteinense]|uniref:Plasmid replication initiation protein n=1 Tax=Spirosoma utsteinense TaxID=2585773 RepID=A0ABR6WFW8_9BACT|nr:replication initiation protein [Spirosoma utsteinense]MBC3789153.1 plasmid replication initiation protein [Spirosoma utsteinense]MBC3795073.1 plasmid replication initiation protein [Spirosoma utsteinense]